MAEAFPKMPPAPEKRLPRPEPTDKEIDALVGSLDKVDAKKLQKMEEMKGELKGLVKTHMSEMVQTVSDLLMTSDETNERAAALLDQAIAAAEAEFVERHPGFPVDEIHTSVNEMANQAAVEAIENARMTASDIEHVGKLEKLQKWIETPPAVETPPTEG